MNKFKARFGDFTKHRNKFVIFACFAAIAGWFGKDGTERKPRLVSIGEDEVEQLPTFEEMMRQYGWCLVEDNPACVPYPDDLEGQRIRRKRAAHASRRVASKSTRTRKADSRPILQPGNQLRD